MKKLSRFARALPRFARALLWLLGLFLTTLTHVVAERPNWQESRQVGIDQSVYRTSQQFPQSEKAPQANLAAFKQDIAPILTESCADCHGGDLQEGNIRIDTLDPNLFAGDDVDWWGEILAVLTNGEMPPPDEVELDGKERAKLVEWLATELNNASIARRAEGGHSSFRRMTRYEYTYTMQDLLGLPFDFGRDLPPEANSEDGFQNSSENLHMSVMQFETYRAAARKSLLLATVRGEQPPPIYWAISMKDAANRTWREQDEEIEKIHEKHRDDPEQLAKQLERQERRFYESHRGLHYRNLVTGRTGRVQWRYPGAQYAWAPTDALPQVPLDFDTVAVIPPRQKMVVELGDRIPDRGLLRVRVRASRVAAKEEDEESFLPSLQLEFGWQASNDSSASLRVSDRDLVIDAEPGKPKFYEFEIPLSEVTLRNGVRNISKMGDLPSPSEYLKLANSSVSKGSIQVDYVEVTAPVFKKWPTKSHRRIFLDSEHADDESTYAREILTGFMPRAWRRDVTDAELERKLKLFATVRPSCDDFQQAIIEVLSTVLASPNFLYLPAMIDTPNSGDGRLATRLAYFLWSSTPDEELLRLDRDGKLGERLSEQVARMLADSRADRLAQQFVRQWLGMQLLDYLDVERKIYPHFDDSLKEAMQQEPIEVFRHALKNNRSVLDFLHSDSTMVNERLAKHYGVQSVRGNEFREVALSPDHKRGGLLTQAGLLAMNSDGKDSHPLKRGIWMLERLLNDPPPPPPPAVPEIDLADPEIAKLTLKERIEDHRNDAACMSCHQKIDPWGLAFENFDATGVWRTEVNGKPVDAASVLFNGQVLDGMDGLKRFLLENRQDQFVRAMVYKLTTYALGRPLTFADRSSIDQITTDVRKQGDGLATMVEAIVTSEVFSK